MSNVKYGRLHNRYPATDLDWAKCGTPANYRAHLRRGEKPCQACRQAEYRHQADYRAQRRTTA